MGRCILRQLLVAVGLLLAGALLLPGVALAHPLGNFTINHYDGIRVGVDAVLVDHVLDMAEIPTFTERGAMDTDRDGFVSDAEAAAYAGSTCAASASDLVLIAGGGRVSLRVDQRGISFPQGQGAPTMRLVCVYRGDLTTPLAVAPIAFTFKDLGYAERRGWREMTVAGDAATLRSSDASTETLSARLTTYPQGLLATPSEQATASWSAVAGGPPLPPFSVPDAVPVGVTSSGTAPATTATAAIPNGITDLGADVTSLFQAADLTPWVIALSLLAAAGLGALHALSPGHGKTVMAAYLVGTRGSARQALGLGLVVTISHTIGVLALGLISLSFAFVIPPERLYPILGVVSGAIVIAIGSWLIWQRIREVLATRAAARADRMHAAAHQAGTEHDHEQHHSEPEHEHEGEHEPAHGHAAADAEGWHSHGGLRHTHLPPKGTTVTTRGLIALGLAGGMVPSVSALIVLLGSMSAGRPAFGVVLTVAFGVGMAVVLVGVGLGLVYARGLVERLASGKRSFGLMRWLPTLTAVVVVFAGTLMTVQAIQLAR